MRENRPSGLMRGGSPPATCARLAPAYSTSPSGRFNSVVRIFSVSWDQFLLRGFPIGGSAARNMNLPYSSLSLAFSLESEKDPGGADSRVAGGRETEFVIAEPMAQSARRGALRRSGADTVNARRQARAVGWMKVFVCVSSRITRRPARARAARQFPACARRQAMGRRSRRPIPGGCRRRTGRARMRPPGARAPPSRKNRCGISRPLQHRTREDPIPGAGVRHFGRHRPPVRLGKSGGRQRTSQARDRWRPSRPARESDDA